MCAKYVTNAHVIEIFARAQNQSVRTILYLYYYMWYTLYKIYKSKAAQLCD